MTNHPFMSSCIVAQKIPIGGNGDSQGEEELSQSCSHISAVLARLVVNGPHEGADELSPSLFAAQGSQDQLW